MHLRFLAIALAFPAVAAAEPTWSQIYTTSGWSLDGEVETSDAGVVKIHSRTIEEIPCFWATSSVDGVTASQIADVVSDIPSATKWSTAGLRDSVVLAQSGTELEYWQYLDVPGWTMSADRFWFTKGTLSKGDTLSTFRWEKLADGGAHKTAWEKVKTDNPSAVEPPINVGGWVFEGNGPTTVSYYICTDSGGSIPTMVQTAATRKTLPDTLSDAVREAKRRAAK